MSRIKAILVFIVILSLTKVNGKDLNFYVYDIENGLVQSQVYTVLQDLAGYLWIGTGDGLSKFDGKNFTIYRRQNGLGGNIVSSGLRDTKGNLWFGHYSGTLTKYDWNSKKFEIISFPNSETFNIRKIIQDSDDDILVGTNTSGVYLNKNNKWVHLNTENGLISNDIRDMDLMHDGYVLLTTDKGLIKYRYNIVKNTFIVKELNGIEQLVDVSINDVVIEKSTNNVWIATETKGLIKLVPGKNESEYKVIQFGAKDGIPGLSINRVYIDNDSKIWIAVNNEGLLIADIKNNSGKLKFDEWFNEDKNVSNSPILSLFKDREDNMWIGTDGTGLIQYRNLNLQIQSFDIGRANKSVWSVFEDRTGNVWFGLEGEMAVAKMSDLEFKKVKYLVCQGAGQKGLKQITRIAQDKNGDIYFISWKNGIYKLNIPSKTISKFIPYAGFPQDKINSFFIEKNTFWFATEDRGIIKYNQKTGAVKKYDFSDRDPQLNRIYEIFKDSVGNIWFGTYTAGVIKYDGKIFTVLNKNTGFPLESVITFAEDSKNNIWFVSYDGELIQFDGKQYKDFSFAKGIDGHPVYSVLNDDSTIWVGTTNGVARYEPSDSSFVEYNTKYGFQIYETNQGATLKDAEGNLWFGNIKGVVRIAPNTNTIAKKNYYIPLYINKIQVFFRDMPLPEKHKYDYGKNYLTFHYQAICLANPLRVRYSYKLEGYDENWSPPFSDNKATYSNLPPGKYIFKVIACDNFGKWTENPTFYQFEILAPFWRTWTFYIFSLMLFIFLVFFLHKRRVIKLERYNQELEKEVQKRVSEVSNEKEKVEYALKALRESEKKFRVFTETTSSSIFIIKNRRIYYINPAGEKLLGYSKNELINLKVLNLIHPDFLSEVRKYQKKDIELQNVDKFEIKIIDKNRNEKWVDIIVKPIIFEDEKVLLGTAVEITERKEAEDNLLEEKERLDVTLSSITDAVVTTDISGNIILMNKGAEKISGFLYKDTVGKNINKIFKLVDEKTNKTVQNLFSQALEKSHRNLIEKKSVIVNQNNDKIYIEYTSSVIRDSRSEISGMVFVFRDITESRRIFDELLKTKKLESLGVLAGGIAHDFNNILTSVIGNLSLAKIELTPDQEAFKWIDLSEKSSLRARDLTQQLLTFSKGGAPIKKNAPIDKLIEDTTAFILSGSNVDCKLHFDSNLPHVNMDQGQISQVIQNLIINAQNAMQDGGTVDIEVIAEFLNKNSNLSLKEGSYIKINIKDSGSGIPEEHIDKVFDPFYTTNENGSGLGLSTAYSIIKNHNGSISAASTVGKGAIFTIYLPAAMNIEYNEEPEDTGIVHGNGKILVMDDEDLVLDTTEALLDFIGFSVVKVANGEEAIRVFKEEYNNGSFSAVIMDLTIPGGMGGKEAVIEILKIDPNAIVIVSSGYSNDPVMAEFDQYGFKGMIKKPYNLEEIGLLLKSLGLA